ncbi:hypothetical protein HPB50_019067 [Hyalomma asiaticum]|uniref:Uncharacterized protein n=1 Tax=Hyalomma asiaticum TaxID=266040 RepID=A0ACB7TMV4_HYAAI|nr:hypothetical protein HPB50_019067 [Hyalomma asiaticum]
MSLHKCNPTCIVCGRPRLTSFRKSTGKFIELQQREPRTSGPPAKQRRQMARKAPTRSKTAAAAEAATPPTEGAEFPALSSPPGGAHNQPKAGDHQINFQHYVTLYETEKNKQLRVVPKLTRAHVAPDNLRKMSVCLATQELFSRSTSLGIKVYREAKVPGFEQSEGTEAFTKINNDLFDVLNVKLPSQGIRPGSEKIQVIKDFLALLNTTERNAVCSGLKLFASQMMTEAMRVTLLSTLDIIEYLFGQGAHYILTAKLNQDPLETGAHMNYLLERNMELVDLDKQIIDATDDDASEELEAAEEYGRKVPHTVS